MIIPVFYPKIELISYREWLPIQGDLKTLEEIDFDRLAESLRTKGGFVPAFIWRPTSSGDGWLQGLPYILDGHQRKAVFSAESATFRHEDGSTNDLYPCAVIEAASLTDAKERLLAITSQYGAVTRHGLDELLDRLEADHIEAITKFDSLEVPDLGAAIEKATKKKKDDDYQPPEELPVDVQPGDLITIGEHRIICGDATSEAAWARLFDGERADAIITDPPYNVDYTGKTNDALKIEGDKMSSGNFYQFLLDIFQAARTVCRPGAALYVWHADMEGSNFEKAVKDAGFHISQKLAWIKQVMVLGRYDYHWKHEPCIYGWLPGGDREWQADAKQTSLLHFDRPTRSREHPTMKPIDLMAYQIENSTLPGDIIAEACLGSASTMVAAEFTGRVCYGLEVDPRYCQVAIDRMHKLDPSLPITINGEPYQPEIT